MDSGSIDVNLKIREPLPNTVTVIIYATYSTDIHIDIDNNVFILRFSKPYKKVTYSSTWIPDVASNQCRQFCIAFIKNVRSKISYSKFVSMFNAVNLKYNDYIVNSSLK